MQDKFNQFFSQYNGQAVEKEDPSNLDQCFDLAFAWVDFINIPRDTIRHLYAYEIFTQPNPSTTQYFDIIPNTPEGIPQIGDMVIFGTGVGVAGHVCIASGKADANTFESFDQNWNGHKYAELIEHNYGSVLGWLRPKSNISQVQVDTDKFSELVDKSTKYDQFYAAGYHTVEDVLIILKDKETTIQDQAKDLQTCQTNLKSAQDFATKLNNEELSTSSQLIDAQKALQPFQDQLTAIRKTLDIDDKADIIQALKDLKSSKIKTQPKPVTFIDKLRFLFS